MADAELTQKTPADVYGLGAEQYDYRKLYPVGSDKKIYTRHRREQQELQRRMNNNRRGTTMNRKERGVKGLHRKSVCTKSPVSVAIPQQRAEIAEKVEDALCLNWLPLPSGDAVWGSTGCQANPEGQAMPLGSLIGVRIWLGCALINDIRAERNGRNGRKHRKKKCATSRNGMSSGRLNNGNMKQAATGGRIM